MKTFGFSNAIVRITFVVLAFGATFTSCKKDSTEAVSVNEMTLTVNGSTQTLGVGTIVKTVNATTGLKLYSTVGTKLLSTVTINIAATSLEAKTYKILPNITDITTGTTAGGVMATYIDVSVTGTETTYSNANLSASGTVTITDVTSSYVKGTYDMTLVSPATASKTAESKAIKGQFYSIIKVE
jgi:hypothetical protein